MTVPATSNGNDVGATCASSCVVDSVTAVLLAAPADGIATEMYCSRCCVKSHSGSNPLRKMHPRLISIAAPLMAFSNPICRTVSVTKKQLTTLVNKNISTRDSAECPGYKASKVEGTAATPKQIQSESRARSDKYNN